MCVPEYVYVRIHVCVMCICVYVCVVSVHVCECLCMCTYACIMHADMIASTWKREENFGCWFLRHRLPFSFLSFSIFSFPFVPFPFFVLPFLFSQKFSLVLNFFSRLIWLTNKPQGSTFLVWSLKLTLPCSAFLNFNSGTKLRSWCWSYKRFTNWTFSPAPNLYTF